MNQVNRKEDLYIDLCDGSRWFMAKDGHEFTSRMVASSLSKICRFTGHLRKFYSVAEHSVKCSYMVPEEFAFEALLHDAHESVVGDLSTPVKRFIGEAYQDLSDKAEREMRESFALPETESAEVRLADTYMCIIEAADGLPSGGNDWASYNELRPIALSAAHSNGYLWPAYWDPDRAEMEFFRRFNSLAARR